MADVIQFPTDLCPFCDKPARPGWNEEAILGPAEADGFREPKGWAHPRCLKQETLCVLDQLELMVPQIREFSWNRAMLLQAEIAWLRERLSDGRNVSSSVTHLMHRLVNHIVGWIEAQPVATAKRYRLQKQSALVEAIQFMARRTYAFEIPAPRLIACLRETG